MIPKLRIYLFSVFLVLLTNLAVASDVVQVIGQTGSEAAELKLMGGVL